jgi:hypothetical protein
MLGVVLLVMVGEQAQEMQLAHWIPTTPINALTPLIPTWMGLWFSIATHPQRALFYTPGEPGLYIFLRAEPDLPALQQKCHRHFLWRSVDEALPLYLLATALSPWA